VGCGLSTEFGEEIGGGLEVYTGDLRVAAQDTCIVGGHRGPVFESCFVIDGAVSWFDRVSVHCEGHWETEIEVS